MSTSYTPSFASFQEVAGQGNVIPIYRELLMDRETPVSAFLKLGRQPIFCTLILETNMASEKPAHKLLISTL